MTEPGAVPDELRALFAAEKAGDEPPSGASERVLLRLAGTFAAGLPTGAASNAPAAGPSIAHVATRTRAVRAAALFLTGAAAGAGGYHLARPAGVVSPAPAAAVRPQGRTDASSEIAVPPPPPGPLPQAPSSAPGPRAHPPVAAGAPVTAERSLLEIARTALARGQAEGALAALRRHARQFPNGELGEEREVLVVQALVGTRRYAEARERAAKFTQRYPSSLFAPAVSQTLGMIP